MNDNFEQNRDELLKRFAESLTQPESEREYFDEETLVDIFDFAGDLGNDFLRTEVLLQGARYFPDSEALRQRRSIFYADILSVDALKSMRETYSSGSTLLSELVDLRTAGLSKSETLDKIVALLSDRPALEDEECIQLVNLCVQSDNTEWLFENVKKLCELTVYPAVLMFELASVAEMEGDFVRCVHYIEKVVEEAPYNADYWTMFANAQGRIGLVDEAIQSVDMALAIDPKNIESLHLKAELLDRRANPEDIQELVALSESYPYDEIIARMAFIAKYQPSTLDPSVYVGAEVEAAICALADRFPESDLALNLMVTHLPNDEKCHSLLCKRWEQIERNENRCESWNNWAMAIAQAGSLGGALLVLKFLLSTDLKVSELSESRSIYAIMLYISGLYEECLSEIMTLIDNNQHTNPTIGLIWVYALARLGSVEAAIVRAKMLRKATKMYIDRPKKEKSGVSGYSRWVWGRSRIKC